MNNRIQSNVQHRSRTIHATARGNDGSAYATLTVRLCISPLYSRHLTRLLPPLTLPTAVDTTAACLFVGSRRHVLDGGRVVHVEGAQLDAVLVGERQYATVTRTVVHTLLVVLVLAFLSLHSLVHVPLPFLALLVPLSLFLRITVWVRLMRDGQVRRGRGV